MEKLEANAFSEDVLFLLRRGRHNWVEDRCTIRTGRGPENITALRRFAIDGIKSKSHDTVAATIQRLTRNIRLVFDYLRMTDNARPNPSPR